MEGSWAGGWEPSPGNDIRTNPRADPYRSRPGVPAQSSASNRHYEAVVCASVRLENALTSGHSGRPHEPRNGRRSRGLFVTGWPHSDAVAGALPGPPMASSSVQRRRPTESLQKFSLHRISFRILSQCLFRSEFRFVSRTRSFGTLRSPTPAAVHTDPCAPASSSGAVYSFCNQRVQNQPRLPSTTGGPSRVPRTPKTACIAQPGSPSHLKAKRILQPLRGPS